MDKKESILSKLCDAEFDTNRDKIFGIKSGILWGNYGNGKVAPLLYISKPRHLSQEDYEILLESMMIVFKK